MRARDGGSGDLLLKPRDALGAVGQFRIDRDRRFGVGQRLGEIADPLISERAAVERVEIFRIDADALSL